MLKGKNILITGSSKGIGAATARLAKENGANVIVHGSKDSPELEAITQELGAEKIICDVKDRIAVFREINKLLEKKIQIHCLANIAGAANHKPFLETTEEDWIFAYKTNVLGTVYMCQALIPSMQSYKYGRIVNVGSIRARPQGALAGNLPYAVSKAAILNITAALAREYAKDGISVNSISPGGVETDLAKAWNEETRRRNSDVLLGRVADPKEIAEAICFFLSDKASYATGQDFLIDGGYIIGK
ncbi:SDR family oxidoreductase [Patescibacteria group bacterium]|nr:SDR family oxidoreductase [Patescibacteria group bacterium]